MTTHPILPLYVDDFEAATVHLSAEEDGVYNRLLRLCWRTPGCFLPNDKAWIARKIRLSAEDFERVGAHVLAEFFRLRRGRFVQRRLKREYDAISRKKSARQLAGKNGGFSKARKTQGKVSSKTSVLPEDTRAFPYPYPDSSEDKSSAQTGLVLDPDGTAWTSAKLLLTERGGCSSDQAGRFFGKLLKDHGLEPREMLVAISQGTVNGTLDPKAWLAGAAANITKRREDRAMSPAEKALRSNIQ